MADEKLFKGVGMKVRDGYTPVKEGYQPQPEELEKGYQPAKGGACLPANLKIPTFETGIQPSASPTVVTGKIPIKSQDDK
jgi:hypothetical protein